MTDHDPRAFVDSRILNVYERLPAGERRVADVVLACQGDLASYSASELAETAGVSKATVSRLFQRLGYERFTEARRQAREYALAWGSPLSVDTGDQQHDRGRAASPDLVSRHLTRDLQNLARTFEALPSETLEEAALLLERAEDVTVLGFRNSHALAEYACGVLTTVRPNVRLAPRSSLDVAADAAGLSDRDAVLAVGLRRRPLLFRRLVESLHRRRVPIILVTDPTASAAAQYATVVLRCHNWGSGMFDSCAAAISMLNLLCSRTAARLGSAARRRLAAVEDMHQDLEDLANVGTTAGQQRPS